MSGRGPSPNNTPNRSKISGPPTPLRATIPISSATKEGSNLLVHTSSTNQSPGPATHSQTPSPSGGGFLQNFRKVVDIPVAPGNKSPKCFESNTSTQMRRTASLDAIYSRAIFPRDGHRDIATQTETSSSLDSLAAPFESLEVSTNPNLRTHRRGYVIGMTGRNSEEGLNQEIERIILRSESDPMSDERLVNRQPTPEGRKAPIADLLRKRSANTQTPPTSLQLPVTSTTTSTKGSPDQEQRIATSPQMNRFQRQPPDDRSGTIAIVKPIPLPHTYCGTTTTALFTLTHSSQSAFAETAQTNTNSNNNNPPAGGATQQ